MITFCLIVYLLTQVGDFIKHINNEKNEDGSFVFIGCCGDIAFFIFGCIALCQVWHISITGHA